MLQAFINPTAQDIPAFIFGVLVLLLCAAFTYTLAVRICSIGRSLQVVGLEKQRDELIGYSRGLTAMSVLCMILSAGLILKIIEI